MEQSIIDFTEVLSIDPNHVNAAYARGACENKRGNFAKAIEDYNMALEKDLERDKKGPDYMYGLGASIGQIGSAG